MSDAPRERGMHAPLGVAAARRALVAWVDEAGDAGRTFLEARLLRTGDGEYEVRHRRDAHRSLPSLSTVTSDPFAAREIAQATNSGEYRPLKTAPDLRQGWALVKLDARALWTALDYLYPGCAAHWHALRTGTLRVTHWRETAGRQSGIYGSVKLLPDAAVRNAVRACCGSEVCLRTVAWGIDAEAALGMPAEPDAGGETVPCPEACSLFISFARKVLVLERSPRQPVPGLPPLNAAEQEQVRAIVAAAAAGTLGDARDGEFDEPTNVRRMRYLAARMADEASDPAEARDAASPVMAAVGGTTREPCEGCPRAVPCGDCPLV
ncbi:MAG TPA: DR2241 family protein [Longimicrobiaceae bacterium]|nr:DR2241 family protein [Longimicrobiaceae bacterium]